MKIALFFLTLGTFSGAGLAFLTQVFLARTLPVSDYGAISSAITLVTMIAPLGGFGVGLFWLKAFGEEGWSGVRWIKPSLHFTEISAALALLVYYGWAICGPHDGQTSLILVLLGFHVLGQAVLELASSIYQLEEKHKKLALWQFLPHLLRFLLVVGLFLILGDHFSAGYAAAAFSITSILIFIVGCYVLSKACQGKIELVGHGSLTVSGSKGSVTIMDVLNGAWPFGLAGVFYLIYFQSGIVVTKYLIGDEAAGKFSVAITVMTAVYLLPSVLYNKFLMPRIHRWANHNYEQLRESYRRGSVAMLIMGSFAAVTLVSCAPYMVQFLFGVNYSDVTLLLSILALAIPFRFVATSVGSVLVAKDNMRRKVVAMGGVALVSAVIGVILVGSMGLVGAAITTVLVDALLLIFYYVLVKKFVFRVS